MNLAQLNTSKEALRKTLHELERITPSCHSCLHLGAGKVCEQFHAEPPPDWQRFSGLDFGFEDPYVWMRAALSSDGVWWVYRQDYRTRLTIDEQTERILAADAEELATLKACAHEQGVTGMDDYLQSLNVVATYSDHERGHREMYQAAGIPSVAADKDAIASFIGLRRRPPPVALGLSCPSRWPHETGATLRAR